MYRRTFPGRYDSLEKIRKFIFHAAKKAGLDQSAVYAVELAVDEACANIIDHAYGGEGVGDIDCVVYDEGDQFKVTLRDQGRSFDPAKIPPPQLGAPLEKVKPRGVGFYLMKQMVDEISYQSSPSTGNVMTLIKRKKRLISSSALKTAE